LFANLINESPLTASVQQLCYIAYGALPKEQKWFPKKFTGSAYSIFKMSF